MHTFNFYVFSTTQPNTAVMHKNIMTSSAQGFSRKSKYIN